MSVSGDAILVGSSHDEKAWVYRYEASEWTGPVEIESSAGEPEQFGGSLALEGNKALIGASMYAIGDPMDLPGAAYYFQYDPDEEEWIQVYKLVADDGEPNDAFGAAVAVSGDFALVGAPQDDDQYANTGSAHVFDVDYLDCQPNGVPDACDIDPTDPDGNDEYSCDVDGNGIPDECEFAEDLNEDGVVDIDDVFVVLANWTDQGDPPVPCLLGDVNSDGWVNIDDLFAILAAWTVPPPPQSIYDCWEYIYDPQKFQTCIEAMTITGGGGQ